MTRYVQEIETFTVTEDNIQEALEWVGRCDGCTPGPVARPAVCRYKRETPFGPGDVLMLLGGCDFPTVWHPGDPLPYGVKETE